MQRQPLLQYSMSLRHKHAQILAAKTRHRDRKLGRDIHLLADARNRSGHRESNGADDIRDQDEERRIHTAIIAE